MRFLVGLKDPSIVIRTNKKDAIPKVVERCTTKGR